MLTAALSSAPTSRQETSSNADHYRSSSNDANSSRRSGSNDEDPIPQLRIVPHLDSPRSLVFSVIERDVGEGTLLKIGRFTDRLLSPTRITFKSKVVSRSHAELWTEHGKFYIRDTKSSSGTFLNHIRLSAPNQESRPFELHDGDVVQLGVDYQGGDLPMYRSVKMRIELNRNMQQKRNTYSLATFQSLRNLTTPPNNVSVLDTPMTTEENEGRVHVEECCICLYAIAPFQALFVAPCSHTFHYKCVRPLLMNHPGFLCPLCRSYADLDASVAVETSEVLQMLKKDKRDDQEDVDLNLGTSLKLATTLTEERILSGPSNHHSLESVYEDNELGSSQNASS
ncbi:hypothetical protein DFQ28_003632 [Apophysomyces sp. BC1034]|nr:hypothetical protein DFQ30_001844 [Apophysomyces sp. BC1015]KAG0193712.1 hypothetical protein DFQ28_003632 [Apophysomyces sp. BC1034]